MSNKDNVRIAPADGKLGVLIPGVGAVTTTFIAGVEAVKRGLGKPIGSLTQLATIRLGKRTDDRSPMIKDFVPLAGLNDLVFGGWDIYEDSAYESAVNANVLERTLLDKLKKPLSAMQPMPAVFDQEYVRNINGPNVKKARTKMQKAEMLMDDIRQFSAKNKTKRNVMIWCGSTEVFHRPSEVHQSLAAFEKGLRKNDPEISPSQIYAYASLMSGIPFANGAPNLTTDTPALLNLARSLDETRPQEVEIPKTVTLPPAGYDISPGDDYDQRADLPSLLRRHGWKSIGDSSSALQERITALKERMARERENLLARFTRMEAALSKMNSVKEQITSIVNSMTSNRSG